jgi:hypothetical protein
MLQWLWFEATTEVWEPSMAARGFAPSLRWACTGRDADGRSKGAGFYAGDMLRGSTLDTATGEWLDALANVYGSWRRLPPSVVFDEAAGLAPVLERTVRQPRTALHLFGPWAPLAPRLEYVDGRWWARTESAEYAEAAARGGWLLYLPARPDRGST